MASTIKVDKISTQAGKVFNIPAAGGTTGQFLKTDGAAGDQTLSFGTVTQNPLTLTGSTNTWIPTITAANALTGTANFTYDGNVLDIKNSGTASSINLYCESSNAHYTKIKSGPHASATSYTITLPNVPPTVSGQALTATTAGVASWATVGISHASLWRMTSTFTGSKDPIDANLAEATDVGQGVLGSSMTESSGVFTFPSTGYWNVTATFTFNRASSQDPAMGVIKYTANDGGAWSPVTQMYDYLHSAAQMYGTVNGNCILDITDTANQKVSFKVSQDGASNNTSGSATVNYTYFTFVKLADT